MNYSVTQELLSIAKAYCNPENITISTENKDFKGRTYLSDFITLIEKQNISFEVFDNEIIVGYFTDHIHFEDYSSGLNEGERDYIERAKEFLTNLFTLPIRYTETFKGKTLISEKYCFVFSDGTQDCISGLISHHFLFGFNPFSKKHIVKKTWQYDKTKGCFTTRQPWKADTKAIDVIAVDDDCYIEIYDNNGAYSYRIQHIEFDDYYGCYYWALLDDGTKSLFDTKEKAIEAAKRRIR